MLVDVEFGVTKVSVVGFQVLFMKGGCVIHQGSLQEITQKDTHIYEECRQSIEQAKYVAFLLITCTMI